MSEAKLNPSDIDKALADIQAKAQSDTTLEKGMTVDKRAMGGDTKDQEDPSTDKGRDPKKVKNPEVGRIPASKKSGNFAEQWKGTKGLENAAKEDGVHKNPEPNRGLSKAVEASASSSPEKSASASSSKKVEKAVEASASSSSKKMEKAADYSNSSDKMEKAVVPAEEASAASGSASGSSKLADVSVKKSMDFAESAHKHLTKAFEDGSEADLDKAGRRLLSAKKEILKALEGGATVSDRFVSKLNKAADYFCKSLETYENEDAKGHVHSVNRTLRNIEKALEAGKIEKSVKADSPLNFVKKDGKVLLEMTNEQYKEVRKSLTGSKLVKSIENTISEDARKTIDAVPAIKELFKSLTESNDSLRETIEDKNQNDREFKKSVANTVSLLGEQVKNLTSEMDKVKDTPKDRKSVVSVVESPLAKSVEIGGMEMGRDRIGLILEKGLDAKLVDVKTYLAWDVDKDIPEEHAKYVNLCKSIEARLGK